MPKHCSSYACTNNSSKDTCKQKRISFHKFPLRNPDLLKEWLVNMRRDGFIPTTGSVLCSEHFIEDDFTYQNFTGTRFLKPDAVPSIFAFKTASKRKRTSYQFGFPTDKELCAAWMHAINRKDFIPTKHTRLCSKHFTSASYVRDSNGFRALKKDAIPTLFDFRDDFNDRRRNCKYIHCFVPGCKSKCSKKQKEPEIIEEGQRSIHLFETPNNDKQFEKWKKALSASNRVLTREDHVCELHFTEDEIERFYVIKATDESEIEVDKRQPTLKSRAVPSQFLDLSKYLAKDKSKDISAMLNPVDYSLENNKPFSSFAECESCSDSEDDVVMVEESDISAADECLTFQKILDNLHLIEKPNNWWNISSVSDFIVCARWDEKYTAEKRIVIENNLTIRVFLKQWEINMAELMDITTIDDISALLKKVESYNV